MSLLKTKFNNKIIIPSDKPKKAAKKEQQRTNKISIETCQKTLSKPSSQFLTLKIHLIAPSSNNYNLVRGYSLVRLGNKQTKKRSAKVCNFFLKQNYI